VGEGAAVRVRLWANLSFLFALLLLLIIILGFTLAWPGNWWALLLPVVTLAGVGVFLLREARREKREMQAYEIWLREQPSTGEGSKQDSH
jgi:hypothetical protein